MSATLYLADGTKQEIVPANGTDFKADELYKLLGCDTLEVIDTGDPVMIMIGDENSRLDDECVINMEATRIYREGHGILGDPWKHKEAALARMKEMYGDAFIDCSDGGEPYTIVGNIVYCPTGMLK